MTAALVSSGFVIACGVLLVSGAFKVVQPGGVTGALGVLGVRAPRWAGPMLGVGEMGLGIGGLVAAGWVPAALVGAMYLALAVVAVGLLRRGATESCGCFGEISSPPSRIHVGFDVAAAAIALAHAAGGGWDGAVEFGSDLGWQVIPFIGLAVAGVACAIALLTVLPGVVAEVRGARAEADARHDRIHHHHETAPGLQVETRRQD